MIWCLSCRTGAFKILHQYNVSISGSTVIYEWEWKNTIMETAFTSMKAPVSLKLPNPDAPDVNLCVSHMQNEPIEWMERPSFAVIIRI